MGWKEKQHDCAFVAAANSLFPSWKHTKKFLFLAKKEQEEAKRVKARQTGDGFSPFSTLFFLIPFTRFGRFQSSVKLKFF